MPTFSRWLLVLAVALATSGCDDGVSPDDGGVDVARTTPRFELAADPMDVLAIPFPDDLYLDEAGHPALGRLPSEDTASPPEFADATRAMLAELDGFSATAPIFFSLPPGSIDETSLPQSPADSRREDATVFVVDADSASSTAFQRVPILVRWDGERGLLALRPYDGHPLVPGRRYAAVLSTSVRDDEGRPIGPHPRFAAIRDAPQRPSDPVDGEAHDQYRPVLASLASSNVIAPERVAALAVFTVQRVTPELDAARATVWRDEAPVARVVASHAAGEALDALLGVPVEDQPGLDVEGGVLHRRIGHLVQGRFLSPWLLGSEPRVHGRFRSDGEGGLIVGRREDVPFTLTVPAGTTEDVPLVIFQHGLGGERSSLLAVADALAGAGFAVLAIDIPYHGMRAAGAVVDVSHNYGGTEGPDDFGDRAGQEVQLDFFGVVDDAGELPAFHPVYVRDVLRQSVVDLMTAVRLVREGDWAAVRGEPGLSALSFAAEPIGFVGISLGGIVGTVFVTAEPEVGAAVLTVTGGDLARLVENSASFSGVFLPLLLPRVGLDAATTDPLARPAAFTPEIALVSTLLDRGDSIALAARLARRPKDLLFQMAVNDETVPNLATEALARAARAEIVGSEPVHTDLAGASAPVSDNVEVDGERSTRGLTLFAPATHGLLSDRESQQRYAHPPVPPFTSVAPTPVANPVDAALEQLVYFFAAWRGGAARIDAPAP